MAPPPIRMLLADVDGTLVTQDKVLTAQAIDAVDQLRTAGILFAVTSGRPPLGMEMLIEPLDLQTPIAAFNGGLIVDREMTVLEERVLPEELVVPIRDEMTSFGLSVWIYRGADWYVPDPKGPHVDREAWTVKFQPKVMHGLDGLTDRVAKIVGVSDDHDAVANASSAMQQKFGATRDRGRFAALLPRRHAPRRQQGIGGHLLGPALSPLERGDRHHRRHAERHPDVRRLRAEYRHGKRGSRGAAGG